MKRIRAQDAPEKDGVAHRGGAMPSRARSKSVRTARGIVPKKWEADAIPSKSSEHWATAAG